jgi:cytochrome P450
LTLVIASSISKYKPLTHPHTAQRALIAKVFTPRVMENMRASIQIRVDRLIDRLEESENGDFIAQFAYPLPSLVIFDLLGVPEEHYAALRTSAAAFARFPPTLHAQDLEALEEIAENLTNTERLLQRLISEHRANGRNDLLSALLNAKEGSGALTDKELIVLCNFLLFAGHETTANLLGGSVLHLLQNRMLWNQLKDSPELLGNAVEELLRFVSPVLTVARVLKEDFECHGTILKKGERISLMIGAANHDPTQFENPDQLKFERPKPHSVAFGHGIHYCIGAALARLETQIALSALFRRLPDIRLATPTVEYQPVFFLRALKSLPVCTI